MAYINRLSDINNKLDINIENQIETNNTLTNIDDNIETIRNLNNTTNTSIGTTNNKLDTINTSIEITNDKLDTINTSIGTTNNKLDITNTKLDTLHTDLDGLTFDGSSNLNVIVKNTTPSTAIYNVITDGTNKVNITSNALNNYITNGSTTNEYSKTGLNIYQIYPKKIQYFLYGTNATNGSFALLGAYGCTLGIGSFGFGLVNPRQYSVILVAGSAVPRTLKYHYVNNLGELKTDGSVVMSATNTPYSLGTNIVTINKHWQDGSLGQNDSYHIRIGIANSVGNTIAGADYDDYYNGMITVPNGYIGYLTNYNVWTPAQAWMSTLKWEADGNRYISWTSYNTVNQPHQSGHNGSIGGIYYPGETIGMTRSTAMAGGVAGGMFVLEPI